MRLVVRRTRRVEGSVQHAAHLIPRANGLFVEVESSDTVGRKTAWYDI